MQQPPLRETSPSHHSPTHGAPLYQSPDLPPLRDDLPLRQSPKHSLIDASSPSHTSPRASSSLHQSPITSPLPRFSSRPALTLQNISWRSTSPPMRNLPPFQLANVHSTPIHQVDRSFREWLEIQFRDIHNKIDWNYIELRAMITKKIKRR